MIPSKVDLPQHPDDLTPTFFDAILRKAGVLSQAKILHIDMAPVNEAAFFNAQMLRVHLHYDLPAQHAPTSLIVKMPTLNTDLHANAVVFRPGRKESWFYRRGVTRTPLNVPICYLNSADEHSRASLLVLEDLHPARTGDQLRGATPEQAKLALDAVAAFHAAWWQVDLAREEPELAALTDNGPQAQDLVDRLYAAAWPNLAAQVTVDLSACVRRVGDALVGRVADAEQLFVDSSPHTLIHGDFRLENMLFGVRDGSAACWVVDWEDTFVWGPAFDVAWFLGSGLPVAEGSRQEELLRSYHRALCNAGVDGYTWDDCQRDYRHAMLSVFVQLALTVNGLLSEDGTAPEMAFVLNERLNALCARHRLDELVRF